MVTATVDDDKLATWILQVPSSIRKEIRGKTSTSADFRKGAIEYYIQYSPRATWPELAGQLYYMEYGGALAAARRFIRRTPGKCVYIPLSNSPSSNTNCGLGLHTEFFFWGVGWGGWVGGMGISRMTYCHAYTYYT